MQYRLTPEDLRKMLRSMAHDQTFDGCRRRFDSSDIAQEAFIQVWKNKENSLDDLNFGWLIKVVRGNACKMNRYHTAQKRDVRSEAGECRTQEREGNSPSEIAIHREQSQRVRLVFEKLPNEQQDILRLRYFNGMTYASISKTVDKPIYAVRRICIGAIEAIRREVTK